ncbi:molybdopterin-guanine dinucleotide biosynthesis protein B [Halorubrum sp. LN27]|uniref:molybdopterin-guanine dinucleotide biosynthesis protein B n=1 Tax=Halorubrum sp. LN27 TaxID=2801032 RepID=UPI001909061C|nr:molybdopterin-guanine dinucleotide biosynthesis protein B [Halorubrum sp. LN27]
MKVLCVAGPSDSGKTTVVASLAERLRERGTVATVKHLTHEPDVDTEGKDTARHRAGGAVHTVGLTDEGTWFATGRNRTLGDVLDEFARRYDYAILEGFSDSDVPKVALGDRAVDPPVVARAATADDLDLDEVVRLINQLPSYDPEHSPDRDDRSDE